MTGLRPSDRRIRAVVQPEFPGGAAPTGTWACSACGECFDAMSTRAVLHAGPEQAVPYAFMVCPACAEVLTPVRLRVDRRRLHAVSRTPTADERGLRTARVVAAHVISAVGMRRGSLPDVVRLRAADTHVLAGRLGASRAELVEHLRALDVLAGVERATRPLPVPPAPPGDTRTAARDAPARQLVVQSGS